MKVRTICEADMVPDISGESRNITDISGVAWHYSLSGTELCCIPEIIGQGIWKNQLFCRHHLKVYCMKRFCILRLCCVCFPMKFEFWSSLPEAEHFMDEGEEIISHKTIMFYNLLHHSLHDHVSCCITLLHLLHKILIVKQSCVVADLGLVSGPWSQIKPCCTKALPWGAHKTYDHECVLAGLNVVRDTELIRLGQPRNNLWAWHMRIIYLNLCCWSTCQWQKNMRT